jgi:hypothetical protein
LAIQGLSERLPRARISGAMPLSFITAVSAAGMCAILVTTAPRSENTGHSGVNRVSTPKASINEIGAAVDLSTMVRIGLEGLGLEKGRPPGTQTLSNIQVLVAFAERSLVPERTDRL